MECPFLKMSRWINMNLFICWCLCAVKASASGSAVTTWLFCFPLQTSSPQTEAPKEITTPSLLPESTALPLENPGASTQKGNYVSNATIPTIFISQCDTPSEPPEEAETEKEPQSANENCPQDKTEDSDKPITSHFKMIFKGMTRSRSQESLASTKTAGDEDPPESDSTPHYSQNGGLQGESSEGPSRLHFGVRSNKKEKICFKMSDVTNKAKGKDQGTSPRGEDSQCQKSQVNREQLEATKAIFDLLKEISGLFSVQTQRGCLHHQELQDHTSVFVCCSPFTRNLVYFTAQHFKSILQLFRLMHFS